MFFKITLYISLAICTIGILYRFGTWFTVKIGPDSDDFSVWDRLKAACKGIALTIFSLKFFLIIKILVLDVLLQIKILKNDFVKWLMHMCLFWGGMLLFFMHALDELVTQEIFPSYSSTLDPYQFLRNFFGALVLLGICIAIYRRISARKRGLVRTGFGDIYAIVIIAVIMVTGYFLESAKIVSAPVFDYMIEDYSGLREPEEIIPLKHYWAKEYSVVFSDLEPSSEELLLAGKQIHIDNCAGCHSNPKSAFISLPIAKAISPVADRMNKSRADVLFYYIHFIACFIGLAYLPFSKFFHFLSDPIVLLVNGVVDRSTVDPANIVTIRAMQLDACTNCGTCNTHCSVAPFFQMLGNTNILPSKKINSIKKYSKGRNVTLQDVSEGAHICTECYRCTEVCPTGIYLQDMWIASKSDLTSKGFPVPGLLVKERSASEWYDVFKDLDTHLLKDIKFSERLVELTAKSEAFSACVQCQTCTNVCPVAACNASDENIMDITPQRIMNLLRMGLKDVALGSRMVWDCTTCYQCQEQCPQGLLVTDIIYELKNLAYDRIRNIDVQEIKK